jgi:hypothetical protein
VCGRSPLRSHEVSIVRLCISVSFRLARKRIEPAFDPSVPRAAEVLTRPKSARLPRRHTGDFRVFLHRRVRNADSRCQESTSYPSMGFVPLRGPSLSPSLQRVCTRGVHSPLRPSLGQFRNTEQALRHCCPSLSDRSCSANTEAGDPSEDEALATAVKPMTSMGFLTSKIAFD